jgi:SRSO17 transposase
VGVARQYSGTLGKTANFQVAVSMHEVRSEGAAVLNWRLYLAESWIEGRQRRTEAGIPEDVKFQKKRELALEMIDQARGWNLADRIVVADAGHGDLTAFREGLENRQLRYAVGVQSNTGVWPEPPRPGKLTPKQIGRPPSALHYGKQRPVSAEEAALQAQGWKKVRWREGSKGWLESRFWPGRAQPSHGFYEGRDAGKEVWLLVEWPATTAEPTKYSSAICPPITAFVAWYKSPKPHGRSSKTTNS